MTPEGIILHHSLTRDSRTVSWGAIRRHHIETMGWRDIGYHFGVEQVGDDYEILSGRFPDVVGAHTKGQNLWSLGVCFVGNYDIANPTPGMWKKGVALVRWLMYEFKIDVDHVFPHSDFAAKTCPGLRFGIPRFKEALMNP